MESFLSSRMHRMASRWDLILQSVVRGMRPHCVYGTKEEFVILLGKAKSSSNLNAILQDRSAIVLGLPACVQI